MSASIGNAEALRNAALKVSEHFDADVILYTGSIVEPQDRHMIERCRVDKQRPNAYLVLVTFGGSPHAAYRMGRCLQRSYDKVIACVPGPCHSAGTLIVLAAHELVMSETGILGPLDIQIRKADELFEMQSGLTASEAIETLRSEAWGTFEHALLDLKTSYGGQITLKTALETAANLTTGLFSPLFAQIDPMRLGEDGRSTRIIEEYGIRLIEKSQNLGPDALRKLVAGYPSHLFEIDREEAQQRLFSRVREPDQLERDLMDALGDTAHTPAGSPVLCRLSVPGDSTEEETSERKDGSANPKRQRAKTSTIDKGPPRENDPKVEPADDAEVGSSVN